MKRPAGESTLRLVATLTVAGLFSGLTIATVHQATLPTIRANQAAALERAVFQVLPGAQRMERLVLEYSSGAPTGDDATAAAMVYAGYADDTLVGYAIRGEGAGFQDTIRLLYGYDPQRGRIVGLAILESRETPGLGDRIYKDPDFQAAFRDLAVSPRVELVQDDAQAAHQVDAISGATISSRAVVEIINSANAQWLERLPEVHHE